MPNLPVPAPRTASSAVERSPARGGLVAARTFEDSAGLVWEVFEVHRISQKVQAVSAGLEDGWLAFVCGPRKRRLAPFPGEWQTADTAELERLCGLAREARATAGLGRRKSPPTGEGAAPAPRTRVPRIREPRPSNSIAADGELPVAASAEGTDSVEGIVRTFAHQARSRGLPAIEAMVQLKALLARVFPAADSVARDLRAVRRWFVESYYFERDDSIPDTGAQSR